LGLPARGVGLRANRSRATRWSRYCLARGQVSSAAPRGRALLMGLGYGAPRLPATAR